MKNTIKEIVKNIKNGSFVNEASVSQGIIQPILHKLGWNVFNPSIVSPEFSLGGRRVDFALCYPPKKPIVFIEVKQIGKIHGAEKQLFEYAFHQGVPMAILTDGAEWQFFLPAEQGNYDERRVYKLDLIERELEEIVHRFNRYLNYNDVSSGRAIENARKDYKDVTKKREIKYYMPEAMKKLINEGDEILVELLSEKVESLCGFSPDQDTIINFLRKNIFVKEENYEKDTDTERGGLNPDPKGNKIIGFVLKGKKYFTKNIREFCIKSLIEISYISDDFFERFSAYPKHGKKRRFIANNKYDLYPGRTDLAEKSSYEIAEGWWLGINFGQQQAIKIVSLGCKIANLKMNEDFKILFDN